MDVIDKKTQSIIYSYGYEWFRGLGLNASASHTLNTVVLVLIFSGILYITAYLLRRIFRLLVVKVVRKSKTRIDDFLLHNHVPKYISRLIPIIIAQIGIPIVFRGFPAMIRITSEIVEIVLILTIIMLINAVSKTIRDILKTRKEYVDKPLDSFFQVITIILYAFGVLIIIANLSGKEPMTILATIGAASAILLLIFKDTILGLVASVQVSTNDMIRVGDWIEMNKFGADGTVVQINLNTVKVENFDKTITTIPTHLLITDSFRNYRNMQRSGGRRIKRSINIKMASIRFLEEDEIEKLKKIQILEPYITERKSQIEQYNQTTQADFSMPVNGRRMTNIGLFREYVKRYANKNPNIHKQFHLMVRHMQPTEHGLPLELYMFTNSTVWPEYEGIMADLFDHLFAAIKYFHLEIFESPASDDVRQIIFNNQ